MDIIWETDEGVTYGYGDGFEIIISARVRPNRWDPTDTNVRTWRLADDMNNEVASGKADGLRTAKKAALAAWQASNQDQLTDRK